MLPLMINFGGIQSVPMYGNASVASCSVAAAADVQTVLTGTRPPYSEVMDAYTTLDPTGKVGVTASALFSYWSTTGIGGETISGESEVFTGTTPRAEIRSEIFTHHALWATVQGPTWGDFLKPYRAIGYVSQSTATGQSGAHAIAIVGYSRFGLLIETYGGHYGMTWAYWSRYGTGAWSVGI